MPEGGVRGLGNARKFVSKAWKCQKVGFGGLGMQENLLRGLGNIRKWVSRACKC